ncbi:MAG: hypothetical protein MZV64_16115 [Ignavibacteriales bacterium]|nr:hypothetical protein [Ignavibacteriales bacterium]
MTDDIIKATTINPKEAVSSAGGKTMQQHNTAQSSEAYWYDPQRNYYKIFSNKKGFI